MTFNSQTCLIGAQFITRYLKVLYSRLPVFQFLRNEACLADEGHFQHLLQHAASCVSVCIICGNVRQLRLPYVWVPFYTRTHARTHTLFSLFDKKRPLARPSCRWKDNINGFQRSGMGAWTSFIWLRTETDGGCCECGNEPSGSIQRGEFLD